MSVSGPLAKVMDGMTADFNRLQPGIHVTPVFAGTYFDTMAKTQTSVQGGTPPDVAVLLSTMSKTAAVNVGPGALAVAFAAQPHEFQ